MSLFGGLLGGIFGGSSKSTSSSTVESNVTVNVENQIDVEKAAALLGAALEDNAMLQAATADAELQQQAIFSTVDAVQKAQFSDKIDKLGKIALILGGAYFIFRR